MSSDKPTRSQLASSLWAIAGLGILVLFYGAIAGPKFASMRLRDARSEIPPNLDAIRLAERAAYERSGRFIAIPRGPSELPATDHRDWPTEHAFDAIGWRPHGPTRGVYWVEVSEDGTDFLAHGIIDVDGDGEPAHYVANRAERSQLITPNTVY